MYTYTRLGKRNASLELDFGALHVHTHEAKADALFWCMR